MQNTSDRLDWDNFRLLLALAETGSLRAAAAQAGVALNTMRTKIAQLETFYGKPLVSRSVGGSAMTDLGKKVVVLAEEARAVVTRAAELRR